MTITPVIHRRALAGIEYRAESKDSKFIGVLAGYAAVFNSDSEVFSIGGRGRPWIERIAPGAFTRSLREKPDVRGCCQHLENQIIARAPRTLAVSESSRGLWSEYRLIDTSLHRAVAARVRNRLLDAQSFAFLANRVEWDLTGKEYDVRILLDVDLIEASVVTIPAYAAATITEKRSIGLRAHSDFDLELRSVAAERDAFVRRSDSSKNHRASTERAIWAARFGLPVTNYV